MYFCLFPLSEYFYLEPFEPFHFFCSISLLFIHRKIYIQIFANASHIWSHSLIERRKKSFYNAKLMRRNEIDVPPIQTT